jgi:ATP-dependent Clp protease ATP-binding subunit ClpA
VFERFTERARQAVVFAQEEARRLQHNYVGTEHLLLGLLAEREGLAARVLDALGVRLDETRADVEAAVGRGSAVPAGQTPFTPRAKKTLERALREALSLKHQYIGTEHILLGLARGDEGVAVDLLRARGLDGDRVRGEVRRALGEGVPAEPPTDAELLVPDSPPLAPEVVEALVRLRAEKERAIDAEDFERAQRLRDRERRLAIAARELVRVWREEQRE